MKLLHSQIELTWKSAEDWLEYWKKWIEIDLDLDHCALCHEFKFSDGNIEEDENTCKNCPVAIETGGIFCDNTPYEKVRELLEELDDALDDCEYGYYDDMTPEEFDEYMIDLHNEILVNVEEQYKFLVNLALKLSSLKSD